MPRRLSRAIRKNPSFMSALLVLGSVASVFLLIAIAEFIRRGMAAGKARRAKVPKPVKLRGGFKPTTEDIEAAIAWGRD